MKQTDVTPAVGEQMHALVAQLFPICRSITGEGVRKSLGILNQIIPLQIHEVPSGKKVFDWEIPKEWNINDAYIKDSLGTKIVDFKNSNLHVLNYSVPVHKKISLEKLKKHLYYIRELPDWIPYRTSYYKEDWGFCMSFNQFQNLKEDTYEVCVDATLAPGHLTYGEYFIQGKSEEEVLISTHICHPSLANDNLSGISVATYLALHLQQSQPYYSYRFVFIPATIGAITWLALNENCIGKIKHGLVLSLLGDGSDFTYKKSRRDTAEIDQIVDHIFQSKKSNSKIIDFVPYGYDERQYCSPGFNLPIGILTRATYGQYIQYHTSADDLSLVNPNNLEESLMLVLEIIRYIEENRSYLNLYPKGEPQLGKRGLYNLKGGNNDTKEFQIALLWILNYSDGGHSILDISKKSGISFSILREAADKLCECNLLEEVKAS